MSIGVDYQQSIYQKKYKKSQRTEMGEEMEITSLLDILVILLFFLVINYNPTDLQVDLVKNVDPALSASRDYGLKAIIVQVDRDQNFFIGQTKIGNLENSKDYPKMQKELRESFKMQTEQFAKMSAEAAKSHEAGTVNIIMDKQLTLEQMHEVSKLAAMEGFKQFKFIVFPKAAGASP